MKLFFYFLSILVISLPTATFALRTARHSCFISKTTQVLNKKTGENSFSESQTKNFLVTKDEHENHYKISLLTKKGAHESEARVSTGTVLNSTEGNVIQAEARLSVFEKEEYLGLVMSTQSPFARSHVFLEQENEGTFTLINLNLKCHLTRQIIKN